MKLKLIIVLFVCGLFSCKKNSISLTQGEYEENKSQGFWVLKTKKTLKHNQEVIKPRYDRQTRKLARENKQIERYNSKQRQRLRDNNVSIRSSGNGAHYKTFEHH